MAPILANPSSEGLLCGNEYLRTTNQELAGGDGTTCTFAAALAPRWLRWSRARTRTCKLSQEALGGGRCARWGVFVFVFFYWPEFGRSRTCGLRHCQALGSLPPQRAHHGRARTPRTTRVDPALCTGTSYTDRARTPRKCQWQGAHVQRQPVKAPCERLVNNLTRLLFTLEYPTASTLKSTRHRSKPNRH